MKHYNGFIVLLAELMVLENELAKTTNKFMLAAANKRSDLEMSTLIQPFEYYGHKCGFARNVKVDL